MARFQIRVEEKQRADARICLTAMVGEGLVPSPERDRCLSTFDLPVLRKAAVVVVHRLRTKQWDRPIVSNIR